MWKEMWCLTEPGRCPDCKETGFSLGADSNVRRARGRSISRTMQLENPHWLCTSSCRAAEFPGRSNTL
jgi:hypothetical protein